MMARAAVAPSASSCCASPLAWGCGRMRHCAADWECRCSTDRDFGCSTSTALSGAGVPAAIPRQRPPWFSSDAQYEAFLQMTARDLGPQCMTATSIDVEHLDE